MKNRCEWNLEGGSFFLEGGQTTIYSLLNYVTILLVRGDRLKHKMAAMLVLVCVLFATNEIDAVKRHVHRNTFKGKDILSYQVTNHRLSSGTMLTFEPAWSRFILNEEEHQRIWTKILEIIPDESIDQIDRVIFSRTNGYLAFVEKTDDSQKWTLNLDIQFLKESAQDPLEFRKTILHEFAHVLFIGDKEMFFNEEKEAINEYVQHHRGSDEPMIRFYCQFWEQNMDEFERTKGKGFYEKHHGEFVTEYASENPCEDIAETFVSFVLSDKPIGESMIDQKILLFYDYPSVVAFRSKVLEKMKGLTLPKRKGKRLLEDNEIEDVKRQKTVAE